MTWKSGLPTPKHGDVYLFADFEPADTVMKCELSNIFYGGIEIVSENQFYNPPFHKDRTDYYYYNEENGVTTYYMFWTFCKIMVDPVGGPVFSHYTELEYPKGDF